MKVLSTLTLFRPVRFAILQGGMVIYALVFSQFLVPETTDRLDSIAVFCLVLIPLFLGRGTSLMLHAVWHRPAAATLPGIGHLQRSTALPLALAFGAILAGIAHALGTGIPFLAAWAAAVAMQLGSLPLEKGLRWHGSHVLTALLLLVPLGIALNPEPFANALRQYAVAVTIVAIVFSGLCLHLTEQPERIRRRASQPISTGMDFFDRDVRELAWSNFWIRRKTAPRPTWTRDRHPTTLADWNRVQFYELMGFEGGVSRIVIRRFLPLLAGWLGMEVFQVLSHSADYSVAARLQTLHQTVWGGAAPNGAMAGIMTMVVTFLILLLPLPPVHRSYPISRDKRAIASVRFAVLQLGALYAGLLILALVIAFALAAAAGWPATNGPPALFGQLLASLPLAMVLLWMRALTRANGRLRALLLGTIGLLAFIGSITLSVIPGFAFSPTGLTIIGVTSACFALLFVRTTRRHYARADLAYDPEAMPSAFATPTVSGRI